MYDTYMLNYECSNCWAGFLVEIMFGHEALQNLRCPNCGNATEQLEEA